MKRLPFTLLAGLVLSSFSAIGGTMLSPCVEGPLSSYIGAMCGLGDGFFAKNFFFEAVDLSGSGGLATADDIWVTPLTFGKGFAFSSAKFDITGSQHVAYAFNYFIDPPPPIIPGFDFFLDAFSPVAPGYARATTDVCVGGEFVTPFNIYLILSGGPLDENGCESDIQFPNTFRLEVFHNGTRDDKKLFDKVLFTERTNVVDVRTVLELNANGVSSQINGLQTRALVVTESPEPGTVIFGAFGLLLLVCFRHRRRPETP